MLGVLGLRCLRYVLRRLKQKDKLHPRRLVLRAVSFP